MSKKNSIVEINGRRIDTRTGQPVNIDGVLTRSPSQPALAASKPLAKPAAPIRQVAQSAQRAPQAAHTLMRGSVKKPVTPTRFKTSAPAQPMHYATNNPPTVIDSRRLRKAQTVPRSQAISRFGLASEAAVPVDAMPPTVHLKPAYTRPASIQTTPKTTAHLLEQAVRNATSHRQPKLPKKSLSLSKRLSAISLVVVVGAALLGLVASQNLSSLKVQIASAKAGFNASLPGYSAPGYHVADLNYSPGSVTINYHSNSDQRAYTVIEKSSSWNSETLRDSFVTKTTSDYQTVEAAGRTIYLYGNKRATWVNGGVWYQVQSSASLSDRQLVSVATSL